MFVYFPAGVLQYENHQSPVLSIHPITTASARDSVTSSLNSDAASAGDSLSFQLITLEENATVCLWVVSEISNPDQAGSQSDLGLRPGGRVKLIKSSVINLQNPLRFVSWMTSLLQVHVYLYMYV